MNSDSTPRKGVSGALIVVLMALFVAAVAIVIGIVASRSHGGDDVERAKPSFEAPK
jgi:hypothetical protein